MEYRELGRTGVAVSVIGLGTMTFGEQNSESEGHEQLDYAVDHGVNLIDAAEMYPVPPRAQTQGATERIIGSWLKKSGKRDKVVLASKAAGPTSVLGVSHIRDGEPRLDRRNLQAALDASLQRLQTDHIDLYQMHWPDRPTNFFGQLGYRHAEQPASVPIAETLAVLADFVRDGKVRYIGVSNETPWGLNQYLNIAATAGMPRVASIQNPYNLLNRSFEVGLAEIAIREQVPLLAYSPLAFGVLTGKFLDGARPPQARVVRWPRFARYNGDIAEAATSNYVAIARRHGLDAGQMALAFINSRPFLGSTLIGATTMEQLRSNIASSDLKLSGEVLEEIEQVHRERSNPCP